eukprot:6174941-Pleurochrysis_carterae.AAC.2
MKFEAVFLTCQRQTSSRQPGNTGKTSTGKTARTSEQYTRDRADRTSHGYLKTIDWAHIGVSKKIKDKPRKWNCHSTANFPRQAKAPEPVRHCHACSRK